MIYIKEIKGYEDYLVYSNGTVYSRKTHKFLKPRSCNGYLQVYLTNKEGSKNHYVHRLVAEAFIPNDDAAKVQINHKNEIKSDNRIENLEWCTPKENCNYGTRNKRTSEKISKKVRCIETGEIFNSLIEAAKSVDRNKNTMSAHLTGRTKSCGGKHFEYYNGETTEE